MNESIENREAICLSRPTQYHCANWAQFKKCLRVFKSLFRKDYKLFFLKEIMENTKKIWFGIGIIVAIALISIIFYSNKSSPLTGSVILENMEQNKIAVLETSMGVIEVELYSDMPITSGNFENLITQGVYNGVIFHRIIDGFMIQGGDPTGTGYGDPKIPKIKDEFTHAGGNKNSRGTISMANAGPNTGSSQFFINLVDNSFLDTKHPAFGKVISGMDVVDKMAKVDTNSNDKPLVDVKIISARIK